MAKRLYLLHLRGNQHEWGFNVYIDPVHVDDWRADGIEIYEVCNVIPAWVVNAGLSRVWVFLQDLFHFKNPF